jgi:hypothetical protein
MNELLALSPTFGKGIITVLAAVVLFVGSVYFLLTAIFGLRMAYLVLAVSLFAWMILFSMMWVFQPTILGVKNVIENQGPRGTEPHWQIFAAGTAPTNTKFPETSRYPGPPWQPLPATKPPTALKSAADNAKAAIQKYLAAQAAIQFERQGQKICDPAEPLETDCVTVDPSTFSVENFSFATSAHTSLVAAEGFFSAGGPQVIVYAYHDPGNVPVYSWAFFGVSILGFILHIPFLDRAEKKRKAILTGGTAPPWYGPA